ncbi:DUF3352 domain-containing protein [Miltoncostaea marina]|uniref:DUF3352 domain-containing protein n=1 Tax=Miltoncostaea marina TaxID=2843215 RepID=UPI001C3D91BF|nr:DUF3352 domain-containing protein [Miltoncostaea marina]
MIERLRRRTGVALVSTALAGVAIGLAGCGGGDSEGGAAAGEIASYVPAGSPMYLEASTDFDGPQWTQVDALAKLFPAYPEMKRSLQEDLRGDDVDFERDVAPLLGDRAAVASLGVPEAPRVDRALTAPGAAAGAAADAAGDQQFVGVVELTDGKEDAVRAFLQDQGMTRGGEHAGAEWYRDDDGTVTAVADGVLVLSDAEEHLFAALDAHEAGGDRTLGGTDRFTDALGKLPEDSFGHAYIDLGAFLQSAAAGNPQAQQLGLADYDDAVLAASLVAEAEGARVKGVLMGAPEQAAEAFSPGLTSKVPADAIAYLGFSDLSSNVADVVRRAMASGSAEANQQLEALTGQLPQLLGVSLEDLSALTSGEHALVVTGAGRRGADVALALQVEDGAAATRTLDALRTGVPQLLRSFSPQTRVPQWQRVDLAAGVQGWRLPLSPQAGVVYGVDGDLAIVGTTPRAVTAVQRPTAPLADAADFRAATDGMPGEVTSLAWLDVEQAVAAAERAGAFRDASRKDLANLRPLKSVSAWTTGGETPTFEVFVRITG